MSHRKYVEEIRSDEDRLPGWLWFFLILPITLIVALLYRYRQNLNNAQPARYSEPDSIPLNMGATRESGSTTGYPSGIAPAVNYKSEPVLGVDEEDVAAARSSQEITLPASEAGTPSQAETQQARDDLKIVEGIGPSISGILNDRGITTYHQLAETSIERLVEILTEVRLNRIADPATWPEQARLAAEGRWDDLKAYQNSLSAGKEK